MILSTRPGPHGRTLTLARELEELLQERTCLEAAEACRLLLRTDRIRGTLAERVLRNLVAGDSRFALSRDGSVRLAPLYPLRHLPLHQVRFTVFDLETTGGSPATDRILEIGAIRVERGTLGDAFGTLVNPGVPVPPFITAMTGIRPQMVAGAPGFEGVAGALSKFIGPSVLVAHNLPFDLGFLNRGLFMTRGFALTNPALCTVRLGRRLLSHLPDRRLETLAKHCGLTFRARHRALGDAEVTARLFLRFLDLLVERGVKDLESIERFLKTGEDRPSQREAVSEPRGAASRPPPCPPNGGS